MGKQMTLRRITVVNPLTLSLFLLLSFCTTVSAQTRIKPGMNFFSLQQDIELGQQASREIEQQLPLLRDAAVTEYINSLGRKLARNTNMSELPWEFKAVNAPDVNAFALPGGFVYVNRGLIETADTEGQLVSVLCHEISHVTLRHSTNQLSKAMLAQVPLSVLGGLTGGRGIIGQLSQLGIGIGANLAFMKFSRTAETQADIAGVQLMVRSGYDPNEMIHMFEKLEHLHSREPGKMEGWFSSHPPPENRIGKISNEISLLRPSGNLQRTSSQFTAIRSRLSSMPAAPKSRPREGARGTPSRQGRPEPPARDMRRYEHPRRHFTISYPSNWSVNEGGSGVVFVPDGGIQEISGNPQVAYGAVVDLFEPHGAYSTHRRSSLDEATDELIDSLTHANPHLEHVENRSHESLSGKEAIGVILSGPYHDGQSERVWLVDCWLNNDTLFYIAFIAPTNDFKAYQPTFREMARSITIHD